MNKAVKGSEVIPSIASAVECARVVESTGRLDLILHLHELKGETHTMEKKKQLADAQTRGQRRRGERTKYAIRYDNA